VTTAAKPSRMTACSPIGGCSADDAASAGRQRTPMNDVSGSNITVEPAPATSIFPVLLKLALGNRLSPLLVRLQ